MYTIRAFQPVPAPWNKGRLSGQKRPLRLQEIWAIRIRLELQRQIRELSLFNLALDNKLRAYDLMALQVCDIVQAVRVQSRALIVQQKAGRPVQFETTAQTRAPSTGGWRRRVYSLLNTSFQVGWTARGTFQEGNMRVLSIDGYLTSGWIQPSMEPIP